ncbi:MAG: hypothetical protein HW383_351 [Candidatus Magasanikbacteria bacterium]|nr:hypothetical protein [Candidatus Magasanikbacteria bacterium]
MSDLPTIDYISVGRYPTTRAYAFQMREMLAAFLEQGVKIELITDTRTEPLPPEDVAYFSLPNLRHHRLPVLNLAPWGVMRPIVDRLAAVIIMITWAIMLTGFLLFRSRRRLIYTRDAVSAGVAVIFGFKTFYEVHHLSEKIGSIRKFFLKHCCGLVTISEALARRVRDLGCDTKRVLVAPDAVDTIIFHPLNQKEARATLGLPDEQFLIVYTGHFYKWKGVYTLAEAGKFLPDSGILLVGGEKEDREPLNEFLQEQKITNVTLRGHEAHNRMPLYLAAADVLVLPNSAQETIGRESTSPLKLFEYATCQRPIVASDVSALREILNDETAEFFTADDAASLAAAVQKIKHDPARGREIAEKALTLSVDFSWKARARRILDFLDQK